MFHHHRVVTTRPALDGYSQVRTVDDDAVLLGLEACLDDVEWGDWLAVSRSHVRVTTTTTRTCEAREQSTGTGRDHLLLRRDAQLGGAVSCAHMRGWLGVQSPALAMSPCVTCDIKSTRQQFVRRFGFYAFGRIRSSFSRVKVVSGRQQQEQEPGQHGCGGGDGVHGLQRARWWLPVTPLACPLPQGNG